MEDTFNVAGFLDLPWNIIIEIIRYLPADYIRDTLLAVPQLRPVIIEEFFSQHIHFIISPTVRPHVCSWDPLQSSLIDISSYGQIKDFIAENPDIHPEVVQVITNQDFPSLQQLLEEHREYFLGIPLLQFHIERCDLKPQDLNFLFAFPNLNHLQTTRVTFQKGTGKLNELFPKMLNLKEIVLLGHTITDWSSIELPPNLVSFDASWHETDISSMTVPEKVTEIFWNGVSMSPGVLASVRFPPRLKTLLLTNNELKWINISQLPQTLEDVDLSHNAINSFTFEGEPMWPPNLKSILLPDNQIDDRTLSQLKNIKWPQYLEVLRLDYNEYSSLENLRDLPDTLRYLDLSNTRLSTLKVNHNQDEYPYFRFPHSLEKLKMERCQDLLFGDLASLPIVPPEHRVVFPPNLEHLDLTLSTLERLAYFIFPSSLKFLWLSGMRLSELGSYDYTLDGKELVNWNKLTNLSELLLFFNNIHSIANWDCPRSLRVLDLRRNAITSLTPETLLFSEEFCTSSNLQTLNMEQNEIESMSIQFLPSHLTSFNLSTNKLKEFTFSSAFFDHRNLQKLDLSYNAIERISSDGEFRKKPNLKVFDISHSTSEVPFQMESSEFYKVFEKMGLDVITRRPNVRSVHKFR